MTAPPTDIGAVRANLVERLNQIQDEITRGHLHRQIFREIRDAIIAEHPETDGTFLFSYGELYAHSQALLIRRMADRSSSKPNSLWWAFQRVRATPEVADRRTFVSMMPEDCHEGSWERAAWTDRNESAYTSTWGPGSVPEDARLEAMQAELTSSAEPVVRWVDTRIAHSDSAARSKDFDVRFTHIDAALDCMHRFANELSVLLTSSHRFDEVAIQGDWKAPLRLSLWPAEHARIEAWQRAFPAPDRDD